MHITDLGIVKKRAYNSDGKISWTDLVSRILTEIYGRKVVYYPAAGHRSQSNPGIDRRLYRGLYGIQFLKVNLKMA